MHRKFVDYNQRTVIYYEEKWMLKRENAKFLESVVTIEIFLIHHGAYDLGCQIWAIATF